MRAQRMRAQPFFIRRWEKEITQPFLNERDNKTSTRPQIFRSIAAHPFAFDVYVSNCFLLRKEEKIPTKSEFQNPIYQLGAY